MVSSWWVFQQWHHRDEYSSSGIIVMIITPMVSSWWLFQQWYHRDGYSASGIIVMIIPAVAIITPVLSSWSTYSTSGIIVIDIPPMASTWWLFQQWYHRDEYSTSGIILMSIPAVASLWWVLHQWYYWLTRTPVLWIGLQSKIPSVTPSSSSWSVLLTGDRKYESTLQQDGHIVLNYIAHWIARFTQLKFTTGSCQVL